MNKIVQKFFELYKNEMWTVFFLRMSIFCELTYKFNSILIKIFFFSRTWSNDAKVELEK